MAYKYRHDKTPRKRRKWIIGLIIITLLILAIVGGLIGYDLYRHRFHPVDGSTRTIAQAGTVKLTQTIDQPTYSFTLPSDWKQINSVNAPTEHSVTWQAGKKDEDNRFLQIYTDTIPKLAVNRVLPVRVNTQGTLDYDNLSDNCSTFTPGGSFDPKVTLHLRETPAKWQDIDFICDLPKPDYGVTGTGSKDGINTIIVNGSHGTHKYFFAYTDRNIRPNITIFYDALESFHAK